MTFDSIRFDSIRFDSIAEFSKNCLLAKHFKENSSNSVCYSSSQIYVHCIASTIMAEATTNKRKATVALRVRDKRQMLAAARTQQEAAKVRDDAAKAVAVLLARDADDDVYAEVLTELALCLKAVLTCPIGLFVSKDPVFFDNHLFDRRLLQKYHGERGRWKSPITNADCHTDPVPAVWVRLALAQTKDINRLLSCSLFDTNREMLENMVRVAVALYTCPHTGELRRKSYVNCFDGLAYMGYKGHCVESPTMNAPAILYKARKVLALGSTPGIVALQARVRGFLVRARRGGNEHVTRIACWYRSLVAQRKRAAMRARRSMVSGLLPPIFLRGKLDDDVWCCYVQVSFRHTRKVKRYKSDIVSDAVAQATHDYEHYMLRRFFGAQATIFDDGGSVLYMKQDMFLSTLRKANFSRWGGRQEHLICRLCGGNGHDIELEAMPTGMRFDHRENIAMLVDAPDWGALVKMLS